MAGIYHPTNDVHNAWVNLENNLESKHIIVSYLDSRNRYSIWIQMTIFVLFLFKLQSFILFESKSFVYKLGRLGREVLTRRNISIKVNYLWPQIFSFLTCVFLTIFFSLCCMILPNLALYFLKCIT